MEILALAGIAAASVVAWRMAWWWDRAIRQERLCRDLEERLRSRDERLRTIDAELRKVHAVVAELLDPVQSASWTPQNAKRMEALEALYAAGELASGNGGWPHG